MARHSDWDINCKIYIGGLSDECEKYDLEDAFSKYGPIRSSWVARRPPGFGFVEMEDERDARDAAKGLDGTRIAGNRVRVEMSTGRKREARRSRSRSRGRRSRSRTPPRRSRRSPSYRSMERRRSRSRSRSRSDRGGDRGRSRSR